jgi:hypothetical protein
MDKFVDMDKLIDIDRTLILLPARVKYSTNFIECVHYLNMRVILRGLRKFFFVSAIKNPVFSFKKLQQIIYKIVIKMKILYQQIPPSSNENILKRLNEINDKEKYKKNYENLRKMEEEDDLSDYDDQGEYANLGVKENNNNSKSKE